MKIPELQNLFYISESHIRCKLNPKSWFATARTSNRPENLQGFHATHVLVQVDEASAVPEPVFETMEGILSNADFAGDECLLVLTGNPNFNAGEFFNAFNKNRELYHRITVSGDKATRHSDRDGKFFVSRRVTEKYRSRMEAKYGAESAVYDVRVAGMFPRHEDDAIIPLAYAQQCVGLPLPHFDDIADPITLVMDVSRFGGAKTTLSYVRKGHVVKFKFWPGKLTSTETVNIAKEAVEELKEQGIKYDRIIVDEPGIGGPIIDQMRAEDLIVQPYNGGIPMQRGIDPDDHCRRFINRRVRDYWNLRVMMERKQISIPTKIINGRTGEEIDSEDLVNELASVHYMYQLGSDKLKCESKQEMVDRLGKGASPDMGDTIVMGACGWYNSTHGALADILMEHAETVDDDLHAPVENYRPMAESETDMDDGLW